MEVTVSGRPPSPPGTPPRRPSRKVLLSVTVGLAGLVVSGLVLADQVRSIRAEEAASVRLVLTATTPVPAGTEEAPAAPYADAVLGVTVRNDGPAVRLLEQRLDGVGPVAAGPDLAAGSATVLVVRWRVLCSEIGNLFGPQSLDLLVRTGSGGERRLRLPLGPPRGEIRRTFRAAAVDECERLLR